MIRETGYHKYKNRAGKDNSLPALFFICNIFHIFIPYKKKYYLGGFYQFHFLFLA